MYIHIHVYIYICTYVCINTCIYMGNSMGNSFISAGGSSCLNGQTVACSYSALMGISNLGPC